MDVHQGKPEINESSEVIPDKVVKQTQLVKKSDMTVTSSNSNETSKTSNKTKQSDISKSDKKKSKDKVKKQSTVDKTLNGKMSKNKNTHASSQQSNLVNSSEKVTQPKAVLPRSHNKNIVATSFILIVKWRLIKI